MWQPNCIRYAAAPLARALGSTESTARLAQTQRLGETTAEQDPSGQTVELTGAVLLIWRRLQPPPLAFLNRRFAGAAIWPCTSKGALNLHVVPPV